jgi:hypothetical protein
VNKKLIILVVAIFIVLTAVPAMAAQPLEVQIEAPSTIDPEDADPFQAVGPAVDDGLLCASGEVFDLSGQASGPPEGSRLNIKVVKRFVCADGSGTFDVKLIAKLDLTTGETTGSWVVAGGTGKFAALHGSGQLSGFPIEPGVSILDVYDGKMH